MMSPTSFEICRLEVTAESVLYPRQFISAEALDRPIAVIAAGFERKRLGFVNGGLPLA